MDYGQSQASYGYAPNHAQARGNTGGIRPVGGAGQQQQHHPGHSQQYQPPASATGGYAQSAQQQQQMQYGAPAGYGPPANAGGGIARVDRTAQINDYVAKQKAAKQNAPLIRKENQRLAEQRAISASRGSTKSNEPSSDDYLDDHSTLAPPTEDYRNGGGRPVSGVNARTAGGSTVGGADRRTSSGVPTAATAGRISGSTKSVTYEADREPPSSSSSGGGGGMSNGDLVKRVGLLEEQIKLLKQQNRIFLSFMQNTEQQLMDLRSSGGGAPAAQPERSRSRAGAEPPAASGGGGYPNNMSEKTKQVLQRSQSERHTQPPPPSSSAGRVAAPAASSPAMQGMGGGGDFDQTFAPLDNEKERLKSAKKKAGLLNLREKMAQKQSQPPANQEPPAAAGRGYKENQYQEYDEPHQNAGYGYAGGHGGGAAQPSARQQPIVSSRGGPSNSRGAPPASAHLRPAAQPTRGDDYDDDAGEDNFAGGGGGGHDSFGGGAPGVPVGADEEVETFPCPNCDRRFNSVALAKHVAKQLCKQKPRKVYNMAQKRLDQLAAEAREAGIKLPTKPIVGPAASSGGAAAGGPQKTGRGQQQQEAPLKKKAKWRVDHEKFMQAIQAGKVLQNAVASGIPLSSLPPPVTREEDDDRTPCPHCGRKFQSNVADRHIPHCKNTRNKPKATVASAARLGSTARR